MRPAGIGERRLKPIRLCSAFSPTISSTACSWQTLKLPAGRGKDALKSLTALDALGVQAQGRPANQLWPDRMPLRRSATANSGETRQSSRHRRQGNGGPNSWWLAHEILSAGLWRILAKTKKPKCLRRSETDLPGRGRPQRLGANLHDMAEVPINQGDFAAAEKLYSQALTIARAIGNQKGQARELLNLGVISGQERRLHYRATDLRRGIPGRPEGG